jgi:hypothetical protein
MLRLGEVLQHCFISPLHWSGLLLPYGDERERSAKSPHATTSIKGDKLHAQKFKPQHDQSPALHYMSFKPITLPSTTTRITRSSRPGQAFHRQTAFFTTELYPAYNTGVPCRHCPAICPHRGPKTVVRRWRTPRTLLSGNTLGLPRKLDVLAETIHGHPPGQARGQQAAGLPPLRTTAEPKLGAALCSTPPQKPKDDRRNRDQTPSTRRVQVVATNSATRTTCTRSPLSQ